MKHPDKIIKTLLDISQGDFCHDAALSDSQEREEVVAIINDISGKLSKTIILENKVNQLEYALSKTSLISRTDITGTITYANEKFQLISQYSETELIGNNHNIVNSGYHPKSFWANMWKTITKGEVWHNDVCNKSKNGNLYWVETYIIPIKDVKGTIVEFMSVRNDITQRKKAEAALEKVLDDLSEAQQIAQQISQIGRWELNLTTQKLTWSPEIFNMFEIDASKFGATYEAFINVIHPNDREMVNNAYTQSLTNKLPYEVTHRLLMNDGRVKWVTEKCRTYYDDNGKPLKSIGTVQDVTKQKTIENILKQQALMQQLIGKVSTDLINISPTTFDRKITANLKLITTFYNAGIARLYRVSENGESVLSTNEWFDISVDSVIMNSINFSSVELKSILSILKKEEHFYLTTNGSTIKNSFKSVSGVAVHDEEGNISGFIALFYFKENCTLSDEEILVLKTFSNAISDAIIKVRLENNLLIAKEEAEKANIALKKINNQITEIYNDVDQSIRYATQIQESILCNLHPDFFSDKFIYYKPKNLISGDFYWGIKKGDISFLAVGDCTGHGVPAAMLMMMVTMMLESVFDNNMYESCSQVLNHLELQIRKMFKSELPDQVIKEGFELGLYAYNHTTSTLEFSGAKRPLVYFTGNQLNYIAGSKHEIGGDVSQDKVFENYQIKLPENAIVYCYSDGIIDQFCKNNKRKFTRKRLLEFAQKHLHLPLHEQHKIFEAEMAEWMGKTSQTDDMLLMAFRVGS